MSALLEYFYPSDAGEEERGEVKLYIAGASFGSLPAQILYGAPYTKFPFGRCIKGMMLLVPVPSFRHFPEYHKHLNWLWWVFAGPVVKWDWFGVVPKLMAWMMGTQFKSVERAEGALRTSVVDAMDSQEREVYEVWCRENGITQAQAEREMAEMAVRSVATTWSGIRMLPSIGHADWGFHPDELDEEHTRPPVLVVRAKADNMAPEVFQRWLVEHYRGARMRKIEGGHMAPRYYMDELWGEIMDGA
ncbi:hypothetical protein HYDPIDRAFT_104898 [Hydnomerulius pinastri MD-312]|nr:hypothetical protein HYDPIDRAFT_104898 [Hydnomerulius pinastri MD-312]